MTIEEIASTVNLALKKSGYKQASMAIHQGQPTGRDVAVELSSSGYSVTLYPAILGLTSYEAVKTVLSGIGAAIEGGFSDGDRQQWSKRLVPARPDQITLFQEKLSSGNYPRFKELVASIERATDRLVAIHLANGLLANGQTAISSRNADVLHWGTTSQFASGKKMYSLIPLLSVYTTRDVYKHFSQAFANFVLTNLDSVCETSVRRAYCDLVVGLTNTYREDNDKD